MISCCPRGFKVCIFLQFSASFSSIFQRFFAHLSCSFSRIAEKNDIPKKTKKRLKRKKRWVADRFFLLDVIVSFVQKKNNHPQQKKTSGDSSCDRFFCPAPSHAIPPREPRVSRAHHVEVAGHRAPIQPKTSLSEFVN